MKLRFLELKAKKTYLEVGVKMEDYAETISNGKKVVYIK